MKKKLVRVTTVPISLEKLLGNQLNFMNDYYDVIAVSSKRDELEAFGETNGLKTFAVEMTRQITPFKDLLAVIELFSYFRKIKPTIVHTHTPKAGLLGMIAAKLAGVPVRLHTVAGLPLLEATGLKRIVLNAVERITYFCAHRVYPNSFGLKTIIEREGFCSVKKLKVIANGSSNGINVAYFDGEIYTDECRSSLRHKLGIMPDDFVYIFVGRLVGDKGINELVLAFKRLSDKSKNIKLLLVGSFEPDLDPLKEETHDELSKNTNIIVAGFKSDVRPYLAISDVMTFPSYREGFPNVVMQAGAMGLPSIVSDINGCNEIITNRTNGLIVKTKNVEELANAMLTIKDDRSLFRRLKASSRSNIVNKYSQHQVWEGILNEYKEFDNV